MDAVWDEIGRQGPLVLVLAFFLWGFYKEWWKMGNDFRRLEKEKDEWKARAIQGLGTAETAAHVAEELKEVSKP